MTRTYLGLDENVEAALCYIGLWGAGVLFLVIDDRNRFIRFHSLQSVLLFFPLTILFFAVKYISFLIVGSTSSVQGFINTLFFFVVILLCLLLIVKALQREWFKIPFIGDLAERYTYRGVYKLRHH
jgi:uncharacterized membrane protein